MTTVDALSVTLLYSLCLMALVFSSSYFSVALLFSALLVSLVLLLPWALLTGWIIGIIEAIKQV